jgi:hypothetical protein
MTGTYPTAGRFALQGVRFAAAGGSVAQDRGGVAVEESLYVGRDPDGLENLFLAAVRVCHEIVAQVLRRVTSDHPGYALLLDILAVEDADPPRNLRAFVRGGRSDPYSDSNVFSHYSSVVSLIKEVLAIVRLTPERGTLSQSGRRTHQE